MIMQVHDELVFELKKSDIEHYSEKISTIMSEAENLSVPLVVNTLVDQIGRIHTVVSLN